MHVLKLMHYIKEGRSVPVNGFKTSNTVELINQTLVFDANECCEIHIGNFKPSLTYVEEEMDWYLSQSLDVSKIGKTAKIWAQIADENAKINSNYGYLMFSAQNGSQFNNVVKELQAGPKDTRKAVAYYTNPYMHYLGGNDHICTMYVSYLFRDDKLNAVVSMRSNDIRYGLIGADLLWQQFMLKKIAGKTAREVGNIYWHAASLHLYDRHFNDLDKLFGGSND